MKGFTQHQNQASKIFLIFRSSGACSLRSFGAGFTLLEMLIYIALLSLLMSGALQAAYRLSINAESNSTALAPEREGDFVLRKFDQIFSGMSNATLRSNTEALITGYDGTQTDISLASGAVMIAKNSNAPQPLTSSDVSVDNLQFALIPAQGSRPLGLTATATINGIDFAITKYVRQ